MEYIILAFNIVTAVIAIASVICATTTAPQNKPWAITAYKILNKIALNNER